MDPGTTTRTRRQGRQRQRTSKLKCFPPGTLVRALWPPNRMWYPGTVVDYKQGRFFIKYEDDDTRWLLPHQIRKLNNDVAEQVADPGQSSVPSPELFNDDMDEEQVADPEIQQSPLPSPELNLEWSSDNEDANGGILYVPETDTESEEDPEYQMKSRKFTKKKKWTEEEKRAVQKQFGAKIARNELPGKKEIEQFIQNMKIARTWTNVKDHIRNTYIRK